MNFAFCFLKQLSRSPYFVLIYLAKILGFLAYYMVVPRRKVGQINLAKCYPTLPEKTRRKWLKQHFYHMALLMLEYGKYWYAPASVLKNRVRYHNKFILDNALAKGERVILLYPHFTAFEAAVYALNQDIPLISVYSHQKNNRLDENDIFSKMFFWLGEPKDSAPSSNKSSKPMRHFCIYLTKILAKKILFLLIFLAFKPQPLVV